MEIQKMNSRWNFPTLRAGKGVEPGADIDAEVTSNPERGGGVSKADHSRRKILQVEAEFTLNPKEGGGSESDHHRRQNRRNNSNFLPIPKEGEEKVIPWKKDKRSTAAMNIRCNTVGFKPLHLIKQSSSTESKSDEQPKKCILQFAVLPIDWGSLEDEAWRTDLGHTLAQY